MTVKLIKTETHPKWGVRHLIDVNGDKYVVTAAHFVAMLKPK